MSRRQDSDIFEEDEEAEEVHEEVEEEQVVPVSEQEGEDLLQNPENDYRAIRELDQYEPEAADAEEIALNPQARRRAERELDHRDQFNKKGDDVEDYFEEQQDGFNEQRFRPRYYQQLQDDEEQIEDARFIDAQECKGKLHIWITEEETKKYIRRTFIKFLNKFRQKDSNKQQYGPFLYSNKMEDLIHENKQSLGISYNHFKEACPTLALWLGLEPTVLLPELNAILYAHLCKRSKAYQNIVDQVQVKFFDLPIHDRIRELNISHIEKLVQVKGMVTVRGEVYNQLKRATFKCVRCGQTKGPFFLTEKYKVELGPCRSCQSTGPYVQDKIKCVYRNYQVITLQESPSDVDAGRIPRSKEVILTGDNVDSVKPGEEVEIIGVFVLRYECSMNIKQGFPVFKTFVEANSLRKFNEANFFDKTKEIEFQNFARKPNLDKIIYNSIAPSIYGHFEVKRALSLALFGGIQKRNPEKMHKIRGDINVLLLGDPGIAKSQFLKSLQKIFHRCVYATGKGASAVGLTATVKQDTQTGEWKLQAGAMVLADKGLCLIDEFDKMNEQDRTSIHEAMEQQTISISKAGIVANLNARCTVIAAANPVQGRYNETLSFVDNVNLSDPILSRFDIVKVIRDRYNEQIQFQLSTFVINMHMENHPYNQQYTNTVNRLTSGKPQMEIADQQFLKQYIKYAREKYTKTVINDACAEMIRKVYVKLRESSEVSGGIRITTRHLESMIRLCEAHAKMHLRTETIREDASVAIQVMLLSYYETQKPGPARKMQHEFKYCF